MRKWHRHGSRPRQAESLPALGQAPQAGSQALQGRASSRFGVLLGILFLVAIGAVQWWHRQPVTFVRLEGLHSVDTAEVRALLPKGDLRHGALSLEEWRRTLLQHPLIAAATVYWEAPGVVTVQLRERRLLGILHRSEPATVVDEEGRLLRLPSRVVPMELPRLELPASEPALRAVLPALWRTVPWDSVSAVSWHAGLGWSIRLRSGAVLILGDTTELADKWNRWIQCRRLGMDPLCADLRWRGLLILRPPVQHSAAAP